MPAQILLDTETPFIKAPSTAIQGHGASELPIVALSLSSKIVAPPPGFDDYQIFHCSVRFVSQTELGNDLAIICGLELEPTGEFAPLEVEPWYVFKHSLHPSLIH